MGRAKTVTKIKLLSKAVGRGRKVEARIVDRMGPWAITPFYGLWNGFAGGGYNVTHLPTGYGAGRGVRLDLRQARKLMRALAAMPNQTRWRRLRNPRHMTFEMKALGTRVADRCIGVDVQEARCD